MWLLRSRKNSGAAHELLDTPSPKGIEASRCQGSKHGTLRHPLHAMEEREEKPLAQGWLGGAEGSSAHHPRGKGPTRALGGAGATMTQAHHTMHSPECPVLSSKTHSKWHASWNPSFSGVGSSVWAVTTVRRRDAAETTKATPLRAVAEQAGAAGRSTHSGGWTQTAGGRRQVWLLGERTQQGKRGHEASLPVSLISPFPTPKNQFEVNGWQTSCKIPISFFLISQGSGPPPSWAP